MYPQADDELTPGTVLQDRYEILKRVGGGGFGSVYLARHRRFRQFVAVKKLHAAQASPDIRAQFEKEAALLFGLSHRGLPKVVDAFAQDDGDFLVMEYVEGKDLGEVLTEARGPVEVRRVLEWADQLLDALEYLHSRQPPVIHRDIKPQNVKLARDGRVILLDFGLAKGASGLMSPSTVPDAGDESETVRPGSKSVAANSVGFSPLEQMVRSPTDERSDLYSLGATLYTLLAYAVPESAVVRGSATATGRPDPLVPLRRLNPTVPAVVERAVTWALAIHREDRPASVAALRAALRGPDGSMQTAAGEPAGPSDGARLAAAGDAPTPSEFVTRRTAADVTTHDRETTGEEAPTAPRRAAATARAERPAGEMPPTRHVAPPRTARLGRGPYLTAVVIAVGISIVGLSVAAWYWSRDHATAPPSTLAPSPSSGDAGLADKSKELADRERVLSSLEARLYPANQVSRAPEDVRLMATACGVESVSVLPASASGDVVYDQYRGRPRAILVTATYRQAESLLQRLASVSRILTVTELDLRRAGGETAGDAKTTTTLTVTLTVTAAYNPADAARGQPDPQQLEAARADVDRRSRTLEDLQKTQQGPAALLSLISAKLPASGARLDRIELILLC